MIYFFSFNKCQNTWQKQFQKPQNIYYCGGPWRLKHLGFFTNHLKVVNLIDSDENTDDEEIYVTVDTVTSEKTKRPRKDKFYKINP